MPKHQSGEARASRGRDAPYQEESNSRRRQHHDGGGDRRGSKRRQPQDDTEPCDTFDDMNLKADLLKGIYAYGFEKPSAIQQRAIRPIVRGRDVIAQSQSGTGKTAVFSIAALQLLDEKSRDTQVLVLSPTRELAEQSQRVLQSLGDFMNVSKLFQ
jgi:superfamily II DNA/RNA helicase